MNALVRAVCWALVYGGALASSPVPAQAPAQEPATVRVVVDVRVLVDGQPVPLPPGPPGPPSPPGPPTPKPEPASEVERAAVAYQASLGEAIAAAAASLRSGRSRTVGEVQQVYIEAREPARRAYALALDDATKGFIGSDGLIVDPAKYADVLERVARWMRP